VDEGGLGRSDQGLVGNAESTHVDSPKGKALNVGRYCNILKEHIVERVVMAWLTRIG